MDFVWHEAKDKVNKVKHGVSFELACKVFDDPWHLSVLDGYDEDEERWRTLGLVDGVLLLLVVHTFCISDSGRENIRVISARKATTFERTQYEQSF